MVIVQDNSMGAKAENAVYLWIVWNWLLPILQESKFRGVERPQAVQEKVHLFDIGQNLCSNTLKTLFFLFKKSSESEREAEKSWRPNKSPS